MLEKMTKVRNFGRKKGKLKEEKRTVIFHEILYIRTKKNHIII